MVVVVVVVVLVVVVVVDVVVEVVVVVVLVVVVVVRATIAGSDILATLATVGGLEANTGSELKSAAAKAVSKLDFRVAVMVGLCKAVSTDIASRVFVVDTSKEVSTEVAANFRAAENNSIMSERRRDNVKPRIRMLEAEIPNAEASASIFACTYSVEDNNWAVVTPDGRSSVATKDATTFLRPGS